MRVKIPSIDSIAFLVIRLKLSLSSVNLIIAPSEIRITLGYLALQNYYNKIFEDSLYQIYSVPFTELLVILMLGIELIENPPGYSYEKLLNPR